jgi:hypothetical protein
MRFSCIRSTAPLSRKRPSSELDVSLKLVYQPVILRCGMRVPLIFDEHCVNAEEQVAACKDLPDESSMEILDDTNIVNLSTSHFASSEEIFLDLFNSPSGDLSDDTRSLAFSSQGSSVLCAEDTPPSTASGSLLDAQIPSINALLDGAFRNLICARPVRMMPGIRLETSSLGARLTDLVPSIFSPGYNEAVAARAALVPTVARFLTSFLQKSRSPSINVKKAELIRQFSGIKSADNDEEADQSQNEETRLKEVVKTHLWMTMTNGLRDSEPARRLKPLQAFSRPTLVNSHGLPRVKNSVHGCGAFGRSSDDEMLEEGYGNSSQHICHKSVNDDGIQDMDEDDEAEGYEADLIEEYEDGLMSGFEHGKTDELELLFNDNDDRFKRRCPSTFQSPSSMLELQGILPHSDPLTQTWAGTPAPTSSDIPNTPEINSDDKWSNLLDEAFPTEREDIEETEMIAQPSFLTEYYGDVDYEPDFEKWEFDDEQGIDDMLFE